MKLTDLLDQIDRLELEIYPGPWVANDRGIGYEITTQHQIDEAAEVNGWPMPINSGIKDTFPRSDAEFIALARTFTPAASRALRDVLKTLDQYLVKFDQDNMEDHIVHGIVHELRNKIQDQFRAQNEYHKTP